MSNLELISLALTSEFMGIDSENDLFRKLPILISKKIERSVYNRRKRNLPNQMDTIRLKLASYFNEFEDYFIIDSMSLEICKLSRITSCLFGKWRFSKLRFKSCIRSRHSLFERHQNAI